MILTFPSIVALVLLAIHARRTLPRPRALAFFAACAAYGVLRALAVAGITGSLGASFPYVVHEPLFSVLGVSLQEVAGWTIVAYLGWWLGERVSRGLAGTGPGLLFVQVAWACLWLAAVSWAVETTAVAAGWWSWRLPSAGGWLGAVPLIGVIDWGFVGIDFLLPFVALSSPGARSARWRWALLLCFPVHFGAHLFTQRVGDALPLPGLHLAHWLLAGLLIGLALRSSATDEGFGAPGPADRWALGALGLVVADLVLVQAVWLGRPGLLVSIVPLALAVAPALRIGPLAGLHRPMRAILDGARRGRVRSAVVLGLVAVTAYAVHSVAAQRERQTVERLERALERRDRGDLEGAIAALREVAEGPPPSHAAWGLLGEVLYRSGRTDGARRAFESAVALKPDFPMARRHLAVILLQRGDLAGAREHAASGLRYSPSDLQLRYLDARARRADPGRLVADAVADGPRAAGGLAGLAFEVGDTAGAAAVLDAALAHWPRRSELHERRLKLALAAGDPSGARAALARWRQALPADPRARGWSRRLPAR